MRSKGLRIVGGLLALCFTVLIVHAQEKTKVKGLITERTGETIVLKTNDGNTVTVILDDATKVQQPKGLIGVFKKEMSAAVLIPGLKVSVEGTSQDATHILAKSITFDKDDLQTAEMIQAGLTPTEQKVATNQENIKANQKDIATNQQNIATNQQATAANKATIDANAVETSKRFSELSEFDTKGQLDVRFASGSAKISTEDQ